MFSLSQRAQASKNKTNGKRHRALRKLNRIGLEQLEDRYTPAWAGVPPTTVTPVRPVAATFNPQQIAAGNAAITNNEVDYFSFTAPRSGAFAISATTPNSNTDTVLGVFNGTGRRLAYNDDVSSSNTDSRLNVNLTAGTRYFVGITNYTGTPGGAYSWRFQGPSGADDSFEQNDSFAAARNLGTRTAAARFNNLVMADAADWYRFTTSGTGAAGDSVQIDFTHSSGDLDLRLFAADGELLRVSDGTGNSENVSLVGLPAGQYYVAAYGYQGAHNPSYSLVIDPPAEGGGGGGDHTLYMNFDGATLTAADLQRWDGGDWSLGGLDQNNDGILVQRFLNGSANRDQVIQGILSRVQQDLTPFGITVQRTTGLAVENVGATTLFFGNTPNDAANHQACDIDYGNDNSTDVALISDEFWNTTADTITALSDVALHEAGHTFGLFHVDVDVNGTLYRESMGLRYSSSQDSWVQDTSFMDRTFTEYLNHGGGRGSQNAYQTMARNFGVGGAPAASQVATYDASQAGVFQITTSDAADSISVREMPNGTVALNVNGQMHHLGTGIREVRINTRGDARDRVTSSGMNLVQLQVTQAPSQAYDFDKVLADEIEVWNGQAVAEGSFRNEASHDHGRSCPCCGGCQETARSNEAAAIAFIASEQTTRSQSVDLSRESVPSEWTASDDALLVVVSSGEFPMARQLIAAR